MTTLTVRIPQALQDDIDALCREQHRSTSDLVRESLRRYVVVAKMDRLREKLRPCAEAAGFLTDEDVFEAVS